MNGRMFTGLLAVFVFAALPGPSLAGAPQDAGLDYYSLTFSPSLPEIGKEVTVTLVSGDGTPVDAAIQWRLDTGGAEAADAAVDPAHPARYRFTPKEAGTYGITADLRDPRGGSLSTSLEMVIGHRPASLSGTGGAGRDMGGFYISADPQQPRLGRKASFTVHFGDGIPEGGEVRWTMSGGKADNVEITGANKETYSLVPRNQGPFHIRALVVDARGNPVGEVSLGFIPVP